MSELGKISEHAGEYAEQLVTEMLEAKADDNEILLGEFLLESSTIQVQLKVTRNSKDFMDE